MKCESCNSEINPKMKSALSKNACPFCGNNVMPPKRLEQLLALREALGSRHFTNKEELNIQIRDKVVETLLEHFEFELKRPITASDDVIFIEDENNTSTPMQFTSQKKDDATGIASEKTESPLSIKVSEAKKHVADLKVGTNEDEIKKLKTMYMTEFASTGSLPEITEEDQLALLRESPNAAAQMKMFTKNRHPQKLDQNKTRTLGKNSSIRRAD